jgi:osmotically-inducible protein OsmY/uncharacterized protein YrrD
MWLAQVPKRTERRSMSTEMTYQIGAKVLCEGEECGRLGKLVVDPHTRRVTDLIVSQGILFARDTVVPVDKVADASAETVELATGKDELDELSEYHERHYVAPPDGWFGAQTRDEYLLHRVMPSNMAYPVPMAPMIVHRVHEGIPAHATVIERGLDVEGLDGKVGTVDHVLVERESEEIRLLIVDRGLLRDRVVIPIEHVASMTDKLVRVNLNKEQIQDLYHYEPRSEADILVEVKDRLSRIPVDPETIEISLDSGVLKLSGTVPDMRVKRRIVGMVSSVEGALFVDSNLETADTIEARVVMALRSDPRTDIASIDIVARQGLVTLSGEVDNQEIKKAAGEIAGQQKGVIEVINDLEVKEDEDTPSLRAVWLVHGYLGQRTGKGTGDGPQTV